MEIFNKIFNHKKFYIILILFVLISYGQIINMLPWQDDNALFFKLSHIKEAAGYLGYGITGQGAYKYTAAYYYPIYKLFGYQTHYYFLLSLIFYLLATFSLLFSARKILGKKQGNLAALIFAAGFIASDGFIRLYNSVGTSLSIIFISFLFLNYYLFHKNNKIFNYILAVIFYGLAVEFIRYRTHYLISVVLLIEVINLIKNKINISKIFWLFVRVTPFVYIFSKYFVSGADQRSGEVGAYIKSLLAGNFSITYSYFVSISNVITPDWLSSKLPTGLPLLAISFLILWYVARSTKSSRRTTLFLTILLFVWYVIENKIFSTPVLNLNTQKHAVVFLGGFDLLLLSFLIIPRWKKLKTELILFAWISLNILGYAAYQPTVAYESANRFFAHSFFAFALLLGSLSFTAKIPKQTRKIFLIYTSIYLIGNLYNAYSWQKSLLKYRTEPVKKFYSQLFEIKPTAQKGDIFYFDIADNMRGNFNDAFSVAQMPEETALAWRYGNVDRYDIAMTTQFDDIQKLIDEGFSKNQITSFFYSDQGLVSTTDELYADEKPVIPTEVSVEIQATLNDLNNISYPLISNPELILNPIYTSTELINLASDYMNYLDSISSVTVQTPNSWRESKPEYVNDRKLETVWQADRVLWKEQSENSGAKLELNYDNNIDLDKLVWINAYENNSPTEIQVEAFVNGQWQTVGQYQGNSRIKSDQLNIIDLEKVSSSKIRFNILSTLNMDSAGISEIWIIPQKFSSLDPKNLNEFVNNPYGYVSDKSQFEKILKATKSIAKIKVSYLTNKSDQYKTNEDLIIDVTYDGQPYTYNFIIPAGGTEFKDLKFEPFQNMGSVNIKSIKYIPLVNFNE